MKKLLSLSIISMLLVSLLAGCGQKKDSDGVVNISILNSKPEIKAELEKAIKEFSSENKDVNIKIVNYSQSSTYYNKLISMYGVDNAPTMTLVDPAHIQEISNDLVDLSSEKWVKDISGEITDISKNSSGKIVAFPFATEGIGFIYNKKVIDEAGVDVSKINTIEALEDAFKKVEAKGKGSLIIANEDWSLGDHFMSTAYSIDSKNSSDATEYFEQLKSGTVNVKDENSAVNRLLNTFDVMKAHNIYSDSPLTPTYDKCAEMLGKGEVGFWYMGNWASQSILAAGNGNKDFGFLPVPVSSNASDYGNNEITLGVTKYLVIDKKNNSKEQQEAAKRFLNYLVYNEKGNKFLTDGAGVIPGMKNIKVPETDPLVKDIIKYRNENKTIELMNSYLPSDNSKVIGNALRKYLNNEITREELLDTIEGFWKNHK